MNERSYNTIAFWLTLSVLLVILIVPLLVAEIPPVLDYPNHLARMYILAHPEDPYLSRMYAPHWTLIPNIAIDVVMPRMAHIMPLYTAGRIMLGLAIILPVFGTLLYARAAFGRVSWWQLASGLIAYHGLILMGFLNFDLGIGLALLCASGWVAFRERWPRTVMVLACICSVSLFFVHLFSMAFFLLLIGSSELIHLHRQAGEENNPANPFRPWRTRILPLAVIAGIPAVLYLCAPISDVNSNAIEWTDADHMISNLLISFLTYRNAIDLMMGGVVLAFVLYCWKRRYMDIYPPAVLTGAILFFIFLLCPATAMGTAFLNVRFPAMGGFMLFAAIQPTRLPRSQKYAAIACISLFVCLKMSHLTKVWAASTKDIADMRKTIAPVPPGSRVLLVMVGIKDNRSYWQMMPESRMIQGFFPTFLHLPSLLTTEHESFWSMIFSAPSKQPIIVLAPYDHLAMYEGMPFSYKVLKFNSMPDVIVENAPYLHHWQRDFDYVLVLLGGGLPDPGHLQPDKLTFIDGTDIAELYKIRKPDDKAP